MVNPLEEALRSWRGLHGGTLHRTPGYQRYYLQWLLRQHLAWLAIEPARDEPASYYVWGGVDEDPALRVWPSGAVDATLLYARRLHALPALLREGGVEVVRLAIRGAWKPTSTRGPRVRYGER